MIVHVKVKGKRWEWAPECSNCGALAELEEEGSFSYKCPHGCPDEDLTPAEESV